MRTPIAAALALASFAVALPAFAQEVSTTPATTTQTPVTTPSPTPPAPTPAPPTTSTTTTTQAAIDTTEVAPLAPHTTTEQGTSTTTTYVNIPLLTTGVVVSGASYIPAVVIGAESHRASDHPNLYIPVVGPWLDLGQRGCSPTSPCSDENGNKALLIADGVGQGLGAVAILASFFVPEKKSKSWFKVSKDVQVVPNSVGSGYGVAAIGKF